MSIEAINVLLCVDRNNQSVEAGGIGKYFSAFQTYMLNPATTTSYIRFNKVQELWPCSPSDGVVLRNVFIFEA